MISTSARYTHPPLPLPPPPLLTTSNPTTHSQTKYPTLPLRQCAPKTPKTPSMQRLESIPRPINHIRRLLHRPAHLAPIPLLNRLPHKRKHTRLSRILRRRRENDVFELFAAGKLIHTSQHTTISLKIIRKLTPCGSCGSLSFLLVDSGMSSKSVSNPPIFPLCPTRATVTLCVSNPPVA
jgi:hypothetical protein